MNTPSIGRIVHYRLSGDNATQINRRRTTGASIADRMRQTPPEWPGGAQAHIGNSVSEGGVYPMLIVAVHSATHVNGQVFLDGNDVFWALTVAEGDTPGTFSWPTR